VAAVRIRSRPRVTSKLNGSYVTLGGSTSRHGRVDQMGMILDPHEPHLLAGFPMSI